MEKEAVYFLQAETGLIKVGRSTAQGLHRRIKSLETISAVRLFLLGWTLKYTEREIHQRFHEFRLRGEWFFPHAKLLLFIKEEVTPDVVDPPATDWLGKDMATLVEARRTFEAQYLDQVLQATNGNVSQAAKVAGKFRADFYELIKKHGIDPESYRDKMKPE